MANTREVIATTDAPGAVGPYSQAIASGDLVLTAGTPYWITIANHSFGWNWALGHFPPSVGDSPFFPHQSTGFGPDGGPHSGPWDELVCTPDLAFRIETVPEPTTLALMGLGLVALGLIRWRRP